MIIKLKCLLAIQLLMALGSLPLAAQDDRLRGTLPLEWEGDIASRLIDSCDAFLLNKIQEVAKERSTHWSRDLTSPGDYILSIQDERSQFAKLLGMDDQRIHFEKPQILGKVGVGKGYSIYAASWPVIGQINGYGLLVIPDSSQMKNPVIVIPDADQTPEDVIGLTDFSDPTQQGARYFAEKGHYVVIPALINRQPWRDNISNRAFIYRSAFTLGKHIIGYELHKVMAIVDWFESTQANRIIVSGYGEGGLLAFYAGALDPRIDETMVSGYFGPRENIWQEPACHNVFGLLNQFGDAEIATLIAPRKLVIHTDQSAPNVEILPGGKGKPARFMDFDLGGVEAEMTKAKSLTEGLDWDISIEASKNAIGPRPERLENVDMFARHMKMWQEMDRHNQGLLLESPLRAEGIYEKP